jgi:hypothetical protein
MMGAAVFRTAASSRSRRSGERSPDVVEVIGGQQDELQVRAGFPSPGRLLALQEIPHEWGRVREKGVTAAEEAKEGVTAVDEERREALGGLRHRQSGGMRGTRPPRRPKAAMRARRSAAFSLDVNNLQGTTLLRHLARNLTAPASV